jgi:hypothetical protein
MDIYLCVHTFIQNSGDTWGNFPYSLTKTKVWKVRCTLLWALPQGLPKVSLGMLCSNVSPEWVLGYVHPTVVQSHSCRMRWQSLVLTGAHQTLKLFSWNLLLLVSARSETFAFITREKIVMSSLHWEKRDVMVVDRYALDQQTLLWECKSNDYKQVLVFI